MTGVTQVHASGKTDSSKNEKHGDGGRSMQSAEKRIAEIQKQIFKSIGAQVWENQGKIITIIVFGKDS